MCFAAQNVSIPESISVKKLNAINGLQSVCEAFAAKIIRVTNE